MSAADAVVVLHLAFVVFVVAGGLPVLRWRWLAWLHLPAAAWGALVEFCGWVCPLTYLENALRGEASATTFIERILLPILYPDLAQAGVLTPAVRIALGCAVVAVNATIYGYGFFLRGPPRALRPRALVRRRVATRSP